jgi:dihydroneopterin aldolase
MVTIELIDLDFFAYHGVHEEEKLAGNNFLVNLKVEGDFQGAVEHDDLEKTINYETLYAIIAAEMEVRSNLLEHVAGRIKRNIIGQFPEIKRIEISIEKLNPPIKGKCKATRVTLTETY